MFKRFAAGLILLAVMCGVSWGATTIRDYPFDRYSLYELQNDNYGNYLYTLYGDETGFNYQLRELSGNNTAGNQWFATIYENFYYNLYDDSSAEATNRGVYRRTTGGEIPEIPISAIGNIIGGFNFMTVEENQPYSNWSNVYDIYPDPVESFCLVLKNGTGNFTVRFGNPYASHYPYWWHWSTAPNSPWWNDRTRVNSINEPIAYVVNTSSGSVWARRDDGNYTVNPDYTYAISQDKNASGDVIGTHYDVKDSAGTLVYVTSGDLILKADKTPLYTLSGNNIYDINGLTSYDLKYTIETATEANTLYVCKVRKVSESIRLDGFDNNYTFRIEPSTETSVNPGDYGTMNVTASTVYRNDYGSKLGWITFRQRADLMKGYTRYREYTTIPVVIANVVDGNAADEPLQFDMTVYDSATDRTDSHVVSRVKFTWDAQNDMTDQDLGTFYMMQPLSADMPTYYLETKITNRTGTRYELFRYDMLGGTTGFKEIRPQYWKYDLVASPSDPSRDTLPDHFHLDAHSQIAPGLVTVYDHSVYGTVNTAYDTYESFQLQEYDSPSPKRLRLNYTRVQGMYPAEMARRSLSDDSVSLQGFSMQFMNVAQNNLNTNTQLYNIMGKVPAMVSAAGSLVAPEKIIVKTSALNSFMINVPVPVEELSVPSVFDPNDPEPVTSPDNLVQGISFKASGYYSPDIAPLLPISVRLVIPGQNKLLINHWNDLNSAKTSSELFNKFRNLGTVWVRSYATSEVDVDLFRALDENSSDFVASNYVHAFLSDNSLYLDFIILVADSSSTNKAGNKTAFIKTFTDDGRPYILIGDGNIDGSWNLSFYVDSSSEIDGSPSDTNTDTGDKGTNSSSGGGGCDSGIMAGILAVMFAGIMVRKSER